MTKFKVGDTVKCIDGDGGIPELRVGAIITVTGTEGEYVQLAHDPRWLCAERFVLLRPAPVDEELPPAPASVMYFNSNPTKDNDQRLIVNTAFAGEVVVNVVRRGCQYNPYDPTNVLSVGLEPDDAIQLAHDIYRMARAAKKAQAK